VRRRRGERLVVRRRSLDRRAVGAEDDGQAERLDPLAGTEQPDERVPVDVDPRVGDAVSVEERAGTALVVGRPST
jgi:hypothetical protein